MKKNRKSNMLELKKSVIAELSNKEVTSVLGGSTVSTSVVAAACGTINPLNCTMSAYCAH